MRAAILATLLIQAATPCLADDAPQAFESLFGDRVKKAQATRDRTDDLALAKQIVDIAKTTTEQHALLAAMTEQAYALAMPHPDGYGTAAEAMALLAKHVPAKATEARKKRIDALTRRSRVGSADDRATAGLELVDVLTKQGDELAASGDFKEAARDYRQALITAVRLKADNVQSLRDKIGWATAQSRNQARIESLKSQLLRDANDAAAAKELVELYVTAMDQPADAMAYLDRAKDATLAKLVPLAAGSPASLNAEQSLQLGEWYHSLSNTAQGETKYAMLQRTHQYLSRFLLLHSANDLARKKAELMQASIKKLIGTRAVQWGKLKEMWVSKDATYRTGSATSYDPLPTLLTDGGIHSNEFAFHTGGNGKNAWIVIDLKERKEVSRLWIENRRSPEWYSRADGLAVWFSNDPKQRGTKVWQAQKASPEWTIKLPRKVNVRYITIGLPDDGKQSLHLAKVKVFGMIPPGSSSASESGSKSAAEQDEWISKDATYKTSTNSGNFGPLPTLMTEGGIHINEFAFHTAEGHKDPHIVIDLGKRKSITRIWIENRRHKSYYARSKGLAVWLSNESGKRGLKVWEAKEVGAEWTIKLPRKVPVRYITIGLPEDRPGALHLAKVKVYGPGE